MVGVKKVFKIPAFLYLTISFGLGVGLFNGLATVFAQVIAPQGYTGNENITIAYVCTADDAGTLTGVMIGAGLFGAVVTAPIIDKWHKYKETYSVLYPFFILLSGNILYIHSRCAIACFLYVINTTQYVWTASSCHHLPWYVRLFYSGSGL